MQSDYGTTALTIIWITITNDTKQLMAVPLQIKKRLHSQADCKIDSS